MLTISPQSLHSENLCNYSTKKCAEIHYDIAEFTIYCMFCDLKICDYIEFITHFTDNHFKVIDSNKNSTDNINVTDPLELKESKSVHINKDDHSKTTHVNYTNLLPPAAVEHKETTQELSNKLVDITVITPESSLEDSMAWENEPNQTLFVKSLSDAASLDTEYSEESDEIDWQQPFEPNLLKTSRIKRVYKPRHEPNVCRYCDRSFRQRHQLDTHLNIHTGRMPYQCEICGRQFRSDATLRRHYITHQNKEPNICKFCQKTFSHRAALVSHESRHTQKRTVSCLKCDRMFYTSNQMDTHMRKKHKAHDDFQPAQLPFSCDLCSKCYRSASMLSQHKFKKHYIMAKHICLQCGKKFVDIQQLEVHKEVHVEKSKKNSL